MYQINQNLFQFIFFYLAYHESLYIFLIKSKTHWSGFGYHGKLSLQFYEKYLQNQTNINVEELLSTTVQR